MASVDPDPDTTFFGSCGIGSDRLLGTGLAGAIADVEAPAVERAMQRRPVEEAGTQRSAAVGAGVVHREEALRGVRQRNAAAVDFHRAATSGRQA